MVPGEHTEPTAGLLREVMEAHGGFSTWHRARSVRAVMSTGGALFAMRTTSTAFRRTEVIAGLDTPRTEILDFPRTGFKGFFEPDRTWITDDDGRLIRERPRPRARFGDLRKQLHWDSLDSLYFAGYAVWNYLTAPYLLCRSDLVIEQTAPCRSRGELWSGLRAVFPATIPTHCAHQRFFFDGRRLLRRHDYKAEVIGPYAVASHYCDDHRTYGRAVFPTRRKVVPRIGASRVLPFPILVWIELHEAELVGRRSP